MAVASAILFAAARPPRTVAVLPVLKDVTRVATKMHNTMRKQEDVHWEVTTYQLSMDMPLLQEHLCLFIVCILLIAAGRVLEYDGSYRL